MYFRRSAQFIDLEKIKIYMDEIEDQCGIKDFNSKEKINF
jgi:hypothetical protein